MEGYRLWLRCSLSVVAVLACVQAGHSQVFPPGAFNTPYGICIESLCKPADACAATCKVYSLADMGDANLCKWICETIPDMIQPASWKQAGIKLSYYAPGKVMVINHTPAAHAQIDEFLQNLKKTQAKARQDVLVMPAQFAVPDQARPLVPMSASQAYPVPYPPTAPKHLFHFIIRYEGAGVIDSNVVKFTKAMSEQQNVVRGSSESSMPAAMMLQTPPTYVTPTGAPIISNPPFPPPPPPSGPPQAFAPPRPLVSPAPGAPTMPPADAPLPSSSR